jgi:hypothetical protein
MDYREPRIRKKAFHLWLEEDRSESPRGRFGSLPANLW